MSLPSKLLLAFAVCAFSLSPALAGHGGEFVEYHEGWDVPLFLDWEARGTYPPHECTTGRFLCSALLKPLEPHVEASLSQDVSIHLSEDSRVSLWFRQWSSGRDHASMRIGHSGGELEISGPLNRPQMLTSRIDHNGTAWGAYFMLPGTSTFWYPEHDVWYQLHLVSEDSGRQVTAFVEDASGKVVADARTLPAFPFLTIKEFQFTLVQQNYYLPSVGLSHLWLDDLTVHHR